MVHEPFPQVIGADVGATSTTCCASCCLSGLYSGKNKTQEAIMGCSSEVTGKKKCLKTQKIDQNCATSLLTSVGLFKI